MEELNILECPGCEEELNLKDRPSVVLQCKHYLCYECF